MVVLLLPFLAEGLVFFFTAVLVVCLTDRCLCALPAEVGDVSGEVVGVADDDLVASFEPKNEKTDVCLAGGLITTGSGSGTISTPSSSLLLNELLKMLKRDFFGATTGSILRGGNGGSSTGCSFFCFANSLNDLDLGGGACTTGWGGGGVTTTGSSFLPKNLKDLDLTGSGSRTGSGWGGGTYTGSSFLPKNLNDLDLTGSGATATGAGGGGGGGAAFFLAKSVMIGGLQRLLL